jgi:hypothetical protein
LLRGEPEVKLRIMSTVEEIEKAIEHLPEPDVLALAGWFDEYREKLWDARIEADARSGKLDFLIEEARRERAAGTLRSFP